jgi:hypothetical protein
MDAISGVGTADLTRLMVGGVTQQQTEQAKKVAAANIVQQVQGAKMEGIGEVIDAVA